MSSSRKFRNVFCWLVILNYCPDGGNGIFHCSSSFLKATSLICEAQLSFLQKYIICIFSFWWMIKGIWALFYFRIKENIYIMVFPTILNSIIQWKVRLLLFYKISKGLRIHSFSPPPLIIFTKGANIFGHDCILNCISNQMKYPIWSA